MNTLSQSIGGNCSTACGYSELGSSVSACEMSYCDLERKVQRLEAQLERAECVGMHARTRTHARARARSARAHTHSHTLARSLTHMLTHTHARAHGVRVHAHARTRAGAHTNHARTHAHVRTHAHDVICHFTYMNNIKNKNVSYDPILSLY